MPDFLTAEELDTLPKAKALSRQEMCTDVLVIGAGPTGLACAIEVQKLGLSVIVLDKGCLVNSLFHYPANMVFFTTPELLEIGDIPFTTAQQKPTREEALEYYRKVSEHYHLDVRQYEWVKTVLGEDGHFTITATDRAGRPHDYRAKKVIVSTGYYDLANQLGIPGEELPKVSHYYGEPHPYYDTDVLVIGGKNSAAIAVLDLWRHGARVTLVHREAQLHHHVKYWIKPDLENRIKNGEIEAYYNSWVQEIGIDHVVINTPRGPVRIKNDFVLALIGYHPDYDFLRSMGIELSEQQWRPVCDPVSLESNVKGIYVAGVIVAGSRTNEIFIENGRFHGKQIAADLKVKLKP
ncbi:MAG TPA: YpdA family putative bacillithiol disulfide reductase [Candidatus Sulfotelmatobacter sp.]|nr:YpdA family putative bacillithiol disulfide reductase [Candidatus Sulfotelmatobacter sp.]